jgi:hypothetical protein
MMPNETKVAVQWALQQEGVELERGALDLHACVDAVRQWFNEQGVAYETFSATDLQPFLPQ